MATVDVVYLVGHMLHYADPAMAADTRKAIHDETITHVVEVWRDITARRGAQLHAGDRAALAAQHIARGCPGQDMRSGIGRHHHVFDRETQGNPRALFTAEIDRCGVK